MRFSGPVRTASGGYLNVAREIRQPVRVLARNEEALTRTCATLAREADAPDASRRDRAVAALASIGDVVAIPYLLEAALVDPFASREIDALARLGGPDARRALESLAKSTNELTASYAQGALHRIKS